MTKYPTIMAKKHCDRLSSLVGHRRRRRDRSRWEQHWKRAKLKKQFNENQSERRDEWECSANHTPVRPSLTTVKAFASDAKPLLKFRTLTTGKQANDCRRVESIDLVALPSGRQASLPRASLSVLGILRCDAHVAK